MPNIGGGVADVKVTEVKPMQTSKALSPIEVTPAGIEIVTAREFYEKFLKFMEMIE